MKPCDCKDSVDVSKLDHSGIAFNEDSLVVEPNHVVLTMGPLRLQIGMERFKQFAEWYFEEQEIKK